MRQGNRQTALALALLAVALMVGGAARAQAAGSISAAELTRTVKALTADAFGGRAPGTPGEARTVDYLIARFKALGLRPGGRGGAWTQVVPLLHTQMGKPALLQATAGGAGVPLRQGQDIYVSTVRAVDRVTIRGAPLVFVGYGVAAPERGWDDFKGVDLKGKVAVFLVNDPDFDAAPGEAVAGRFGGRAMTYYGRWTYKFEEAARRGAVAALVIHDTPGAGYGWSTVVAPAGESFAVAGAGPGPAPVLLEGWLAGEAAADLFRRAGLDLAAERVRARRADFHPATLTHETFDADIPVSHSRVDSRNVLAKLPGAVRPDETVMIAAHWDAYGIGAPDAHGDRIRRGADDDGLGVAGVLEIARAFKAAPPPARTVVFALWTAEERDLLGSEAYGLDPIYPLATTAANFTFDTPQTAGPARDLVLIGAGQNSLEADIAKAAQAQGRMVTPDRNPERGMFYRADHFSLAKRGVPTILLSALGGGSDLVEGGRTAGDAWITDFTAHCYHQPCDAWRPDWDLRGAVQDYEAVYTAAQALADGADWPSWNAGSEFATVRARTAAARKP